MVNKTCPSLVSQNQPGETLRYKDQPRTSKENVHPETNTNKVPNTYKGIFQN